MVGQIFKSHLEGVKTGGFNLKECCLALVSRWSLGSTGVWSGEYSSGHFCSHECIQLVGNKLSGPRKRNFPLAICFSSCGFYIKNQASCLLTFVKQVDLRL